ncbi:hypothetical protein N9Q27_00890 [bacterium]|nr:hypothetical protein [bacterium]
MMSFKATNTQPQSYASQINSTYHSDEDLFVTVDQRLQELYAKDSDLEMLFRSLAEGMVAAMGYETFDDLTKDIVGMGEIQNVPVTSIDINDTMQRWPDRENLIDIVAKFNPDFVNRIRTYLDTKRKDGKVYRHVAWDGQHTAIALYIIGVYGFGVKPELVTVPVDQYPGDDRAAIRRRFVAFNDGKTTKKLEHIDLYKQHVAGFRHDGLTEFWNTRCVKMQEYFEKYGYYATSEKFGDENRAGAWSRMTEVFNRNFPVEIFERVMYYHSVSNDDGRFIPMEIDNLSVFFRQCMDDGIVVTNEYIDEMSNVLSKITQNTWAPHGTVKGRKVQAAYQNHCDIEKKAGRMLVGKQYRCNQTHVGPSWIAGALKTAGFKQKLPIFEISFNFTAEDLV